MLAAGGHAITVRHRPRYRHSLNQLRDRANAISIRNVRRSHARMPRDRTRLLERAGVPAARVNHQTKECGTAALSCLVFGVAAVKHDNPCAFTIGGFPELTNAA